MTVHESPPGKGPHPALLALVSGSVLFAGWALLAWAGAHEDAGELIGRPTSFQRDSDDEERRFAALITDLDRILDAPEPAALRGRQVVLFDAPVESVVGDWFFWTGRSDRRVPVLLLGERARRQREQATEVIPGERVRIFGFIRLAADTEPLRADPLLDGAQRGAIRRAGIFISALRVERAP